jgi:hypothetical protein
MMGIWGSEHHRELEASLMKEISINLVIQQDEEESVFLQKAVKLALQAFRKTQNEENQKYDDNGY